jgi:hypothetical protein
MRPVTATSDTPNEGGGTKKSLVLTALPVGVPTVMRPDVLVPGTVVAIVVLVAEVIEE